MKILKNNIEETFNVIKIYKIHIFLSNSKYMMDSGSCGGNNGIEVKLKKIILYNLKIFFI